MASNLPGTPSLESRTSSKNFIFLALIGAAVILVGIGASFFFARNLINYNPTVASPTPTSLAQSDDISTWKTHVNKELGFTLKYPDRVDETYFRSSAGSFILVSLPKINSAHVSEKNFYIFELGNSRTVEEQVEIRIKQNESNNSYQAVMERSVYPINGFEREVLLEKHLASSSQPNGSENRMIFVKTAKTVLMLSNAYELQNKEASMKISDQILSTFKLLDPESMPPTLP